MECSCYTTIAVYRHLQGKVPKMSWIQLDNHFSVFSVADKSGLLNNLLSDVVIRAGLTNWLLVFHLNSISYCWLTGEDIGCLYRLILNSECRSFFRFNDLTGSKCLCCISHLLLLEALLLI